MRYTILFIVFVLMTLISCQPSGPKLVPLDLISEGVPLKINAPEDVEVSVSDLGIMKDITIQNEDSYSIQIFESETDALTAKEEIDKLKESISSSEFFDGYVQEDEDGFVFRKRIDETYVNYDFRHAKVLGAKQYVIQAGLSKQYTEDQIMLLYNSVK